MKPHELPVYIQREKILKALSENQVLVVESPTGSGKTTQLPMILFQAGYSKNGIIGVTQPRRIAAVSVCDYIARQLDTSVPGIVGYKMRFEDKTNSDTQMKIMTDGILLQEMKADPMLSRYSVIIIDEAHERSLNIDFILGFLKQLLEQRTDFKVIISSATINAEVFSEYFGGCPVVHIENIIYPIQIIYNSLSSQENTDELLNKIVTIISNIIKEKRKGDILVFLQGEKNIKDCISLLSASQVRKKLFLIPLYGRLSKEEQEKVFIPTPKNKIKIVVATNIAETSVTIDGISTVIDPGIAKINYYNPKTFTSSLVESLISKASCNQRKGRAGRTSPGICYRLFEKSSFDNRPLFTLEEIYRTDLSEVVLRMADIGIKDFESFNFISPPGRQGIMGAVETLTLLGALNDDRSLSEKGKMMAVFPLLPQHSRMIVEAIYSYPQVLEETIIAASFLSAHTPFLLPPGEEMAARKAHHNFRDPAGDFVSYLKIFNRFLTCRDKETFCRQSYLDIKTMTEIVNIKEQLEDIVRDTGLPISSGGTIENYLCAVSRGLIQFVCTSSGRGAYSSLKAKRIHIHPGSVMFRENPKYIVAGEIVKTSRMFARSVSPLKRIWLEKISPELANTLTTPKEFGGKAAPKKRDTTWEILIGNKPFKVQPYKSKQKIAVLPWENISTAIEHYDTADSHRYGKLRGKIVYHNYEILYGYKLTNILKIVPYLNPQKDIISYWPAAENYNSSEDADKLCKWLDKLLKLCRGNKKNRMLGFLTLHTDGKRTYWFKSARGFNTAIETSLGSLELLADELNPEIDSTFIKTVNIAYRKLNTLVESW